MFTCFRCGYKSDLKKNLERHLNRKKTCFPRLEDITINEVKLRNEIYSYTKINQFEPTLNQYEPKNDSKSEICEYCSAADPSTSSVTLSAIEST